MKSVIFYICFAFYMLGAAIKRIKLNYLRKHASKEVVDQYIYNSAANWGKFVIKYLGINVEVCGAENIPKEACLFVGNHQSMVDIPLVIAYVGKTVGFIAKKEILKWKFISYWMEEINCIFMDRSNVRESVKSINEGVKVLKEGHSLVVFPEGTRSKGPQLGEFKKGSMKLATKSGVPVVPVTIDGSYKAFEGNKHSMLSSADIKLTFSEPIYVDKLSKEEQNDLSEIVKDIIAKNLFDK